MINSISVKMNASGGLEVWEVFYKETLVHTFMSREYAEQAARRLQSKLQVELDRGQSLENTK